MNDDRPEQVEAREADLIELLLSRRPAEGSVHEGPVHERWGELDPESRAHALELQTFLAGCRAALSDQSDLSDESTAGRGDSAGEARGLAFLTERVLAATTREDLSWRGDLRLVGGFVVERLRHSRMLRIAAVVLAMHFVGLSVLAYHILRQPSEPYINVDFERRPPPPFPEVLSEPSGELSLPEAGEEPRVREMGPEGADPDGPGSDGSGIERDR